MAELVEVEVGAVAERLLSRQVAGVREVGGGRNSRVYRVEFTAGEPVAVKCYARPDRLDVEFAALEFLWKRGICAIPQPLAVDREGNCAVYQFIAGEHIQPEEVSSADIDAAVAFLAALRQVGSKVENRTLPLASEAYLSVREIFCTIETRLERLAGLTEKGEPHRQLNHFVREELWPELEEARRWSRAQWTRVEGSWTTPLEEERVILSPSDFGFHNVLRVASGDLVFLDFEHFGRDDPAKMAADFLLHPHETMALGEKLKQRFFVRLLACFDPAGTWLEERVRIVLPLYGLKWCVILLNEFIPADLARRRFAGREEHSREELLMGQVQKARAMLARSRQARHVFPYAT